MFRLFTVFFIVLTSPSVISVERGQFCGKCSPLSGVKCIDERTFALCNRHGNPTTRVASCPQGMKCVNNKQICAVAEVGECRDRCGICENGRFACLTPTVFSLCFGSNRTSEVIARCPLGTVCSTAKYDQTSSKPILDFCFNEMNLNASEMDCLEPDIPTIGLPGVVLQLAHQTSPSKESPSPTPTTVAVPTTVTVPTTITVPTPVTAPAIVHYPLPTRKPSPPTTTTELPIIQDDAATEFCVKHRLGKYQVPHDRQCRQYYFCYYEGTQVVGKLLTCAEHSVFNPTSQKCARPSVYFYLTNDCGQGRTALNLFNLQ